MAKYDIFISYSRKDSIEASNLVSTLQSKGFNVWFDQDGILSGDAFKRAITNAIINSTIILFLSSKNSNNSGWTAKELGIALDEQKKIIPIKLDNTPYNIDLRLDLVNLDYVNFYEKTARQSELSRLIRSIEKLKGQFNSEYIREDFDNEAETLFNRAKQNRENNKELYIKILRDAAELGSANAQINLGINLLRSGSVRNENEGFGWLVLATKSSNAIAFYNVGLCYEKGIGIPMDKKKAIEYFRKAAMMGNAKSQYKLGIYYVLESITDNGDYGDLSIARHWLRLSAEQGYKLAIDELTSLSKNK